MTTEIALGEGLGKDWGSTYEAVKGMMAVVIETSGDEVGRVRRELER